MSEPQHIAKGRERFIALCGDKKFMIPVGELALRLAAEEYRSTPQISKVADATRQVTEARRELENASEELVKAKRYIQEMEEIIRDTRAIRAGAKNDRAACRKRLRRLLEIASQEGNSAEVKMKTMLNTLHFYLGGPTSGGAQ